MPKALPPELRLALVAAKRKEPHLSLRALAKRHGLGASTVARWWRRWEAERNVAAKAHRPQGAIPAAHASWLREASPKLRSLKALAMAYAEWSGLRVHPTTLSRWLKRWDIPLPRPQAWVGLGWGLAQLSR